METSVLEAAALLQLRLGWMLILAGLLSGLFLGTGFHREEFLGGYASLRRRLVRLGHIALVVLGALNVLWFLSSAELGAPGIAGTLFMAGSIAMPLTCFLVAWRAPLRLLFALPALLLIVSVAQLVFGGLT